MRKQVNEILEGLRGEYSNEEVYKKLTRLAKKYNGRNIVENPEDDRWLYLEWGI